MRSRPLSNFPGSISFRQHDRDLYHFHVHFLYPDGETTFLVVLYNPITIPNAMSTTERGIDIGKER